MHSKNGDDDGDDKGINLGGVPEGLSPGCSWKKKPVGLKPQFGA